MNLVNVANTFVGGKANRKQFFGKFSTKNDPMKLSVLLDEMDTDCASLL